MNVSKFFMSQKSKVVSERLVTLQTSNDYSKNSYMLPIPEDKITECRYDNSPAHVGNLINSIDFYVPKGTPISAAADGTVIKMMDNSRSIGNTTPYWARGNYIEIKHVNGETTHYEHLRYKGVKVRVGQLVKKGEIIGFSGNTGFTEKPHLHFQVNRYRNKEDFVTLRARFSNFMDVYKKRRK